MNETCSFCPWAKPDEKPPLATWMGLRDGDEFWDGQPACDVCKDALDGVGGKKWVDRWEVMRDE